LRKPEKIRLLSNVGKNKEVDQETIENTKEFIRTVFYPGTKNENYVQTKVLLYKTRKIKSFCSLPPDLDSVAQAIRTVHYQVYIWIRSGEINIEHIDFRENGWKWCEKERIVVPV
jgi:hypothetical protein